MYINLYMYVYIYIYIYIYINFKYHDEMSFKIYLSDK